MDILFQPERLPPCPFYFYSGMRDATAPKHNCAAHTDALLGAMGLLCDVREACSPEGYLPWDFFLLNTARMERFVRKTLFLLDKEKWKQQKKGIML